MDYLSVKTRGNGNPQGKPRVYFTCHPKDFANNFEKISDEILKTQDCAIYYTEDMNAPLPEEYCDVDLGQMNLFVVPITFRLLTEPNRAMDSDIQFAMSQHVAILPIMVEGGIDEFYSKKFGSLQYLNPYSHDSTEISYEEKLKKYLAGVLFDDETAEKVRKAFDAYIFLSYRKKDRQYANELMKLIHANPICRDIAIWYDEFLTPGESFSESIEKMLEKSDLFALLVTPNLVNEDNYVKNVEYPAARDMQKPILPAEMVETDKDELKSQFTGISKSVNAKDDAELKDALVKAFSSYAIRENDNDPMHNYLIGLAYLEGIDVEKNSERAVELITKAAEAELPEAMVKLSEMYQDGYGVELDWNKALDWTKKLADYCVENYGEKDETTFKCRNALIVSYNNVGEYQKALEIAEPVYALKCEILGETHPDTLTSLDNLARTYGDLGDYKKALELQEKCYELSGEILGKKHPDTLASLDNLAGTYRELGEHKKALEIQEKVYALRCEILGEKHPSTLTSLNNLAGTYGGLGEHKKALELQEKVYALRCEVLGEKHPSTLRALNNLAFTYGKLAEHEKALELNEKVYVLSCEVLGEKHPDTLTSLGNLARTYGDIGDYKKALELQEKCYVLRCEVLGKKHPNTLTPLHNLAFTYFELQDYKKSISLFEKAYSQYCEVCGEDAKLTLNTATNLAKAYFASGDPNNALQYCDKVLEANVAISQKIADKVAAIYDALGYPDKAEQINKLVEH